MNFLERIKNNPVYQSIFAIGLFSILLITTTIVRYYAVIARFNAKEGPDFVNRYAVVEISLLLISLALVSFIWVVLLQRRLTSQTAFNLQDSSSQHEDSGDLKELIEQKNLAIIEQNRYLTQAMEVGRELLNINALQEILAKAVDDIQKKFDLYYVQIYLSESSERTLTLRAGSGRVGTELVRRGHRLAVGSGSINGAAAQRKETILVSDTSDSELFLANPLLMRTRSEMAIPLIVSDQVLGVLNLQSIYINGLSPSLHKAIEGLGSQLAIALDHANRIAELEEAQQNVSEQAARLTRVGWKNWLASLDKGEELTYSYQSTSSQQSGIDDKSHNMFMASAIVVSGAEVGNVHIETDSTRHWGLEDIDLVRAVADQLGQKIENLRLLNESDRYREEAEIALRQLTRDNWGEFTDNFDIGGFVFNGQTVDPLNSIDTVLNKNERQIDITIQGEIMGAISIPELLDDSGESEMVKAIANSLSGHLENLRLTEQTKRQVFELSLLNRVNSAMTAQLNLYDLADVVGSELRRGFSASSTFISIYNRDTNMMEYPFFFLDNRDGVRRIYEQPRSRGTGFSSQVIQSGKPLLISRNPAEMIRAGALVVDFGDMPHSYLGVPIIFGEAILGVLSLQNGPDKKIFTESDQELVVSIANTMALALQNSALFIETQGALEASEQRRIELQAINSVVADTTSAVDINEAIDRMAQKLVELIEGEEVSTTLMGQDKQELVIVSARNIDGLIHEKVGMKLEIKKLPDQKSVLDSQKLFRSESNIDDEGCPRVVILPLIGQNGAIGTVTLQQKDSNKGFSGTQINLAETIVYQVSTVLENKQLLSETRNRALREQKVRAITDRIRSGFDQKEILRIAQEEVSSLIGAKTSRSWIGSSEKLADQFDKAKVQLKLGGK
ncbi:MAG: GAF domain-containing protein [Cellvibrionaceae bacterium]|jgi:GAF domain-containing protein